MKMTTILTSSQVLRGLFLVKVMVLHVCVTLDLNLYKTTAEGSGL